MGPDRLNRIAYVDLQGRLCTIAPDGSRTQQLTQNGLIFQNPAWSPNGQQIVAIGVEPGGAGVFCLTERRNRFRAASLRELYFGQVQSPLYARWSPAGGQVGFLVGYPQSIGLYVADASGQSTNLIETGQPFFWDWMPDGAYLLIHTHGRAPHGRLLFVDTDGEDWGREVAPPGYFQSPAISSDGRLWAFAVQDESGQSALTVEHHLTGERLSWDHSGAIAMGWQPHGTHLAYITPDDEHEHFFGPLRVLDTTDGSVVKLTDDTVVAFFWSPDGRRIAYLTLADEAGPAGRIMLNLWVLELATAQRRRLLTFPPTPGFVTQFLPIFDQYAHSHRLWSPASDALVLTVSAAHGADVMVVPLAGEPRCVAAGVMASWSPV